MDNNMSMQQLNQQIRLLTEQSASYQNLKGELDSLERKRAQLQQRLYAAKREKDDSQSKLNQMQTGRLNTLLFKLLPGRRQKLEVCRMMAGEAADRYDTAIRALIENTDQLRRLERQISDGHQAEQKLDALILRKAALICQTGGEPAQQLADYDAGIASLSSYRTELDQAARAGREALSTLEAIIEKLKNAKNWGTFDLIGGGLISDLAKHGNLDDAAQLTHTLQKQIRAFQKELADISIHADFSVQVGGFLKFADFAFDGLIADWMVLDRISSSLSQAVDTKSQLSSALHQLESIQRQCAADHERLCRQRLEFLIKAT